MEPTQEQLEMSYQRAPVKINDTCEHELLRGLTGEITEFGEGWAFVRLQGNEHQTPFYVSELEVA